jgi:hypothetical protein
VSSRSNHNNNAKLASRMVNKYLNMSSQVNANTRSKSAAAQYLVDNPQLMNIVEIHTYVITIIVGTSFRFSTGACLLRLDQIPESKYPLLPRAGRLNQRYKFRNP